MSSWNDPHGPNGPRSFGDPRSQALRIAQWSQQQTRTHNQLCNRTAETRRENSRRAAAQTPAASASLHYTRTTTATPPLDTANTANAPNHSLMATISPPSDIISTASQKITSPPLATPASAPAPTNPVPNRQVSSSGTTNTTNRTTPSRRQKCDSVCGCSPLVFALITTLITVCVVVVITLSVIGLKGANEDIFDSMDDASTSNGGRDEPKPAPFPETAPTVPIPTWHAPSELTFTQQVKLYAIDDSKSFGHTVSLDGNFAIVGAPSGQGSVYIFVNDNNGWRQETVWTSRSTSDNESFGYRVAISGNTAAVGMFQLDEISKLAYSGTVFVYVRNNVGSWREQAVLVPDDQTTDDRFGESIAIHGNVLAVGAPSTDTRGALYVFERKGDLWTQQAKLRAMDTAPGDDFGWAVDVYDDDGATIVVGAPGHAEGVRRRAGAAYAFVKDNGSSNGWKEQVKLERGDASSLDNFGRTVAISQDIIAVGAPFDDEDNGGSYGSADEGSAYVFVRNDSNGWSEQTKLVAGSGAENYHFSGSGVSVMCHDGKNAIVVGRNAPFFNPDKEGSIHVFVQTSSSTTWVEQARAVTSGDDFGGSIAASGNTILVGAPNDGTRGDKSGAAYIFSFG